MQVLVMMAFSTMTGCGTETGNPEGDVSVLYNARSRVADVSLEPSTDRTTVSAVWLRLDPVVLSSGCDGPGDAVALAPLGLADHSGKPFLQDARVPDGPYCGLSTSLVPGDDGLNPLTEGASLALEGTLSDGRRFEVVTAEPIDVDLELAAILRPLEREGAWLVSFDVSEWIDPEELVELTGDPVRVSAQENADLLDAIVDRVPGGVSLHLDRGIDGRIDAEDMRLDSSRP